MPPAGRDPVGGPHGRRTAEAELAVTFSAGDNFRVVASFNEAEVAALKNDAATTDVPTTGDVTAAGFTGKASPQLSVWRRLHVEKDSMGKVTGNTVKGKMQVRPDPNDKTRSICTTDQMLPAGESKNRFERGKLTDKTPTVFDVVESTSDPQGNLVVTVSNSGMNMAVRPANGAFTLVDDDGLQDGEQVPVPDLSTLKPALEDAYLEPEVLDIKNKNVPFKLNVNTVDEALAVQMKAGGGDSWSTAPLVDEVFWAVYVLGAFQGRASPDPTSREPLEQRGDADPGTEPSALGFTHVQGGCLIFAEVVRDVTINLNERFMDDFTVPLVREKLERDAVVHEVGHAVGANEQHPVTTGDKAIDSGDPKEIQAAYAEEFTRYTPHYVNAIRTVTKPRRRP
jgi:hypothetical protein